MKPDAHPDDHLAWYVNGTLGASERKTVENHLHGCARCRDEVAFLKTLRHGVKTLTDTATPGDLGLKRLLRDVRAQGSRVRLWWKPTLAAAAVVIIVQGALLASFWPHESPVTPLGGPKPFGAVAQIVFQPNATEAQIRALLQKNGATLIDGPGAIGLYRIRLEKTDPALMQLREHKDVVKYVAAE